MKGTTKPGDAKSGGFCVTVERVVYETWKREDARETTLCLRVPRATWAPGQLRLPT